MIGSILRHARRSGANVHGRTFLIVALIVSAAVCVRSTAVVALFDRHIASPHLRYIASTIVSAVLIGGPIVVYGFIERAFGRWKAWFALSRVVMPEPAAIAVLAVVFAVRYALLFRHDVHRLADLVAHLSAFGMAYLLVAAALEEVTLRGFVLTELRTRIPFFAANAAQAVLFALLHLPSWIMIHKGLRASAVDLTLVALFGFGLGMLTRRSGSLWLAIITHWLTNIALIPGA